MKIHKNSDAKHGTRLIAEITAADLLKYRLSYDDIDFNNPQTRNMIYDILNYRGTDFSVLKHGGARLVIDAVPDSEGGCIMFITVCRPSRYRVVKMPSNPHEKICMLFGADCLYPLASGLEHCKGSIGKNELYYDGNNYAVIISSGTLDEKYLSKVLSEFGVIYSPSKLSRAVIEEHYEKLTDSFITKLCS